MLKTFNITKLKRFDRRTGWFVAEDENGESVVGVSIIPPLGVIEADADFMKNIKYGDQWKCRSVVCKDLGGITKSLLSNGLVAGIKESKAEEVWKEFGPSIWSILSSAVKGDQFFEWNGVKRNPADLLQDAKGVGPVVAKEMIESWKEQEGVFVLAMDAVRCGIPFKKFRDMVNTEHGKDKFEKIVHNESPFSVYDLVHYGLSFEQADKIALEDWPDKPALEWDSPMRYAGAVKYVLEKLMVEGHMCAPEEQIGQECLSLVGIEHPLEMIEDLDAVGLKMFNGMIYSSPAYDEEVGIAQNINRLRRQHGRFFHVPEGEIQKHVDFPLDEDQIRAIQMALTNKVSIITGGPGTGKTTIMKIIVDILETENVPVQLCAFMGSAKRRMAIATGRQAETLHSAFKLFEPDKFDRIPLNQGYLIVDEMSTVSGDLVLSFLELLGDDVHVIFIGDVDQLPPVGRGEVFAQLLNSSIPRVRLTKLWRNGGAIAQACRDVNNGVIPTGDNKDFFLFTKLKDSDIRGRLLAAEKYFKEQGWEPAQVITPLNERPGVGRRDLNEMFSELRNPNGEPIPFTRIRVGDTVVHLKNNRDLGVYNGMVGKVISRTDEASVILANQGQAEGWGLSNTSDLYKPENRTPIMDVLFDEENFPATYTNGDLLQVDLGYAITAHKSQGNQFPCVFVVLPSNLNRLAMRQIVYTAMSRAKKKLVVLSSSGSLEECVRNEERIRRNSCLAEFIEEANDQDYGNTFG